MANLAKIDKSPNFFRQISPNFRFLKTAELAAKGDWNNVSGRVTELGGERCPCILKYFHPVKKSHLDQLPDPHGPLNIDGKVPSSAIASANIAVQAVLAGASNKSDATTDSSSGSNSRGPYLHLTPAQKFNIDKRASEHGVASTLRYYKKAFPDLPLKETSVRRFKNLFQQSLRRPRSDSSEDLGELPNKKMGRPLLIGEGLVRASEHFKRVFLEILLSAN